MENIITVQVEVRFKRCYICHEWKELFNYHRDRTRHDGLQSRCKICHRNYDRQYQHRKYHDDVQRRTAQLMYQRLNNTIRHGIRSSRTAEIIGTNHQNFLDWIEFKFTESMNWENYGSVWCFEHCCPLTAFDLTNEEELKKAMHWVNIRPFCKIRNNEKKASIDPWLSVFQQIKAKRFLNEKNNFQLLN
jgi:transposase-like protein